MDNVVVVFAQTLGEIVGQIRHRVAQRVNADCERDALGHGIITVEKDDVSHLIENASRCDLAEIQHLKSSNKGKNREPA